MMKQKFHEFIDHLKKERFYEAHEALEELWYPKRFKKTPEVLLLKGLINAAVSFELQKRGRIERSKQVWRNYLKYRQLLFKLQTPYYNDYHKAVRFVDELFLRKK